MNWNLIIQEIFEVCLVPLLGILTGVFIKWLKQFTIKNDNEVLNHYFDMLKETIEQCVLATNQVYVDSLKAQGKFDIEAQKNAFNMTYKAILKILGEDVYKYLQSAIGDIDKYIQEKIEAEVVKNK